MRFSGRPRRVRSTFNTRASADSPLDGKSRLPIWTTHLVSNALAAALQASNTQSAYSTTALTRAMLTPNGVSYENLTIMACLAGCVTYRSCFSPSQEVACVALLPSDPPANCATSTVPPDSARDKALAWLRAPLVFREEMVFI